MREVVFRVLAKRPGHLEAQAETLPIRITAPTLDELQHEAREAREGPQRGGLGHDEARDVLGEKAQRAEQRFCPRTTSC